MRFVILTLVLPLLPALVAASARPRTAHQFDARFKGLMVHRAAGPIVARGEKAYLLARQSTDCSTTCESASDEAAINSFDACATTDITCECTYLSEISSGCLTCLLSGTGYTLASLCSSTSAAPSASAGSGPTTTACQTQCQDAQDQTANQALSVCPDQELTDPCVCAALEDMTTTCLSCLLTASGISAASYQQQCSASTTSVASTNPAVPTLPTGTSSSTGASATGIAGCATSSCTSASDSSSLTAAEACNSNDDACICTNLVSLSSTCLTCVINALGLTASQFAEACPASGFTSVSSSPSTTSTPVSPTSLSLPSTVPAAGPTPSSSSSGTFSSCTSNSACLDATDQGAISQGNACSTTDYVCTCKSLGELSSGCLTCVLTAAGYSQSFYQSSCAAVSASVNSASHTSTASTSTQSSTHNSGMKDITANRVLTVAAGAFALIFA